MIFERKIIFERNNKLIVKLMSNVFDVKRKLIEFVCKIILLSFAIFFVIHLCYRINTDSILSTFEIKSVNFNLQNCVCFRVKKIVLCGGGEI